MTSTDISNGKPERRIVNDFCMTVCTVNGSGSATSNNVLFRALFHMGLPTSGKNVFPSNIKGMATWFVIRVSEAGFTGRAPYDNLVVAMNAGTFRQDLSYLTPGGVVFYADHLALPEDMREDLIVYPMPIKELMKQLDVPRTLKDFTENMLYVGVVGQMLGILRNPCATVWINTLQVRRQWQTQTIIRLSSVTTGLHRTWSKRTPMWWKNGRP